MPRVVHGSAIATAMVTAMMVMMITITISSVTLLLHYFAVGSGAVVTIHGSQQFLAQLPGAGSNVPSNVPSNLTYNNITYGNTKHNHHMQAAQAIQPTQSTQATQTTPVGPADTLYNRIEVFPNAM